MRLTYPSVSKIQNETLTPGGQILCPHCGDEISLSGALRTQYLEKFEKDFKQRSLVAAALIRQKEINLAKKAQQLDRGLKFFSQNETLEMALKKFCITDEIRPLDESFIGSAIVHDVVSSERQFIGTILWATKETAAWTDDWIERIKKDQKKLKARYAVIVSTSLPKSVLGLGLYDDVWVCDKSTAAALASALRFYMSVKT